MADRYCWNSAQRFLAVKVWSRLPFVQWRELFSGNDGWVTGWLTWEAGGGNIVVFAIYADSFLFVFATAILQFGLGVDTSITVCEAAILLCLVCYVTTKVCLFWWANVGAC